MQKYFFMFFIVPFLLIAQSCSSGLSEEANKKVSEVSKRKVIRYFTLDKKKQNTKTGSMAGWLSNLQRKNKNRDNKVKIYNATVAPSEHEVIDELELNKKEKKIAHRLTKAAAQIDGEFEAQKYHVKLSYVSPNDGFISSGGKFFESKKAFETFVNQRVKEDTHRKVCVKRSAFGCVKLGLAKKPKAGKIEKKIRRKYEDVKTHDKGDMLKSRHYDLVVSTETVKDSTDIRVELSPQSNSKRGVASN